MAKIPFLHPQLLADGTVRWHWKPSPRLRKAGWANLDLGNGPPPPRRGKPQPPPHIATAAIEQNRKLEAWDLGCLSADPLTLSLSKGAPVPRNLRFADLVDLYRASPAYRAEIVQRTRDEYDSRIRQLSYWAQDGALPLRSIDPDMVRDLKKALMPHAPDPAHPELVEGSIFKCAGMLRVLRMLLRWAVAEGLLAADPTAAVAIPTTPSRAMLLDWRTVRAIAEDPATDALAGRALRFGFWTMQRRADLAQLGRFHWRELHGADPRDLPALVNAKGEVWGFRLSQQKTGRTVDCPIPPFLHAEVEAAFSGGGQFLLPHGQDPAKHIHPDILRRRVKAALVAAGREDFQLRDLRRSGMSGVKDMGAEKSDVFAISGHPLDGNRRTMADVYMPPNTKAACRAIAAACRTLATIEAREKENDNA